ncbi:uncharacterized protein LOC126298428 [Schistocerca gregaria]|uniref:uncharacterized protein LOC126298428 n=1 Tax=Schistocerca gregaria TaxID=7010 RepID=UPI00211E4F22|nr:uncharacterized protein LOC126298428 [Schistocerca gregaria]
MMDEHILLHPELLDEDELYRILKDRGVRMDYGISKRKLLDVFHRLCVPLPQRQYKLSRRGKELTKMREKQEQEKAKQSTSVTNNSPSSSSLSLSSSSSTMPYSNRQKQHSDHTGKDRLKPPPDLTQSKKIKLNTSTSTSGSSKASNGGDNFLDKIIIKSKSTDKKADVKIEKSQNEEQNAKKDVCSEPTKAKKITLKRPVIEMEEERNTEAVSEGTKPKKVRQKISWP